MPRWLDRWTEKRMEKARAIIADAEAAGHPTTMPDLGSIFGQLREDLRDAVADSFDQRGDVIVPPPGADFTRPPDEAPETQRTAIAAAERAARDAARAPYRAGPAPTFTRIPTTGEYQLDAVTEVLAGFDPAQVYGVYRVPHRYDERHRAEKKTYLEWEIAHAPDATKGSDPFVAGFDRSQAWARRVAGEPEVLDEDMAGLLIARGGLAPEECFGISRLWQVRVDPGGPDDSRTSYAHMSGVTVISSRDVLPVQRALAEKTPLEVAPPEFHVTVLDWEAVAAWNAGKRWRPARVPAPLPHLPGSPQELLAAYLEIVGVAPGDCYGAQITRTNDGPLADLGMGGWSRSFRDPEFDCADGKRRSRLDATEHVVIAYRDRAEYAEGRRRWAAYEDEVLHARLSHLTGDRGTLVDDWHPPQPFILDLLEQFNPFDLFGSPLQIRGRHDRPQLGAYVA